MYSEEGVGSTFKMYLPVDGAERATAAAPDASRGQWSKGTETVLLVEDAPMIRRLAREILLRAGYTVIEAGDADQAMQRAGKQERIDVLLTDLIMPGPSGVELAELLRGTRTDIRVLFMSGYSDNAIVRNAWRKRCVPAEAVHP